MLRIETTGSFVKTETFLKRLSRKAQFDILSKYGQQGVVALSGATPIDSGETARSWSYEVIQERGSCSIIWSNSHVEKGASIAVLLQYGHGTRTGGYVRGRDYINPAIRPIFDRIVSEVWKEVTST